MDDALPLRLSALVPHHTLDRTRTLFALVTGVPLVFADADGTAITPVDEPLRFCGTLVHDPARKTVCLRRRRWDTPEPHIERSILQRHADDQPVSHRCLGGFRDAASPIVVNGQTVGYAVFARSLTHQPDVGAFRQMAVDAKMPPEVGEEVARQALVMSPERVEHIAQFVQLVTNLVASAAYETLAAQKVMALEKLRDDLTHMIVHDLRTPLTSIMGGLQTIIDTDFDLTLVREFVPMSLQSAETLLEMVNTLLDISKLEQGQMKLAREPVCLTDLARVALDQVSGLARERNQALTSRLDSDCPPVSADRDLLRRVIVNLLGNAVKFTPDGGRIEVSSRCEGNDMVVCVSDNGPGIPAEYREKIFEKFGQVETRKTGRKHSTGLGLTFCRMVAEAHGGRIWVDSEEGKGSNFCLCIPLAVPSEDESGGK
jgi:signal transduction histidine kinase